MKKDKNGTPKRRVIGGARRTPGRKTPGSKKKKSMSNIPIILPTASTATRETSKRALFLSPTQDIAKPSESFSSDPMNRIEKSRRALFSSPRKFQRSISNMTYTSCNSSSMGSAMKRKRENDDENIEPRNSKLAKCQGSALLSRISSSDFQNASMIRATSDNTIYSHQQLSASHKQVNSLKLFKDFHRF